jgi:MipA family protein
MQQWAARNAATDPKVCSSICCVFGLGERLNCDQFTTTVSREFAPVRTVAGLKRIDGYIRHDTGFCAVLRAHGANRVAIIRPISMACGAAVVLSLGMASTAFADDGGGLRLQAGGFVGVAPKYEGSKDYEVFGAPIIAPADGSAMDGRIQFKGPDDLRFRVLEFNGFEAGPLVGYRFKRDEGDSERLRGLGDVDGSVVIGGYAAYRAGPFLPFISYHYGVSGDDDTGGVLRFGTELKGAFGPGLTVTAKVGASYADDDYMDAYFSVSPAQSAASKAGLSVFDAESGIKDVFFGLSGDIPIAESWSLKWMGTYARLLGDAKDSPIVETENQFFGGVGLTYTFNSGF